MKLAFPLNQFLKRAADDHSLFTTHMSLFMAIFITAALFPPLKSSEFVAGS